MNRSKTYIIMPYERKKDFPCLKCEIHVKRNEAAVQCNICDLWVHQKCADICDVLFDYLCKQAKAPGGVTWSCKSCGISTAKISKMVVEMDKRVSTLESKVSDGEKDREVIKEQVKGVTTDVNNLKDSLKASNKEAQRSVLAEIRDRESRKTNIVIHQLQEPDTAVTEGEKRKEMDQEELAKVFTAIESQTKAGDIKFFTRLGEKGVNPRPLLIGFYNVDSKLKVLKAAKKLADLPRYEDLRIVPDLTKEQRCEEEELRKEAEKLNSEMSRKNL